MCAFNSILRVNRCTHMKFWMKIFQFSYFFPLFHVIALNSILRWEREEEECKESGVTLLTFYIHEQVLLSTYYNYYWHHCELESILFSFMAQNEIRRRQSNDRNQFYCTFFSHKSHSAFYSCKLSDDWIISTNDLWNFSLSLSFFASSLLVWKIFSHVFFASPLIINSSSLLYIAIFMHAYYALWVCVYVLYGQVLYY